MKTKYTYEEVFKHCLDYFKGDDFAAGVMVNKYILQNRQEEYIEKDPKMLIDRLVKEFVRIEKKYPNSLSEKDVLEVLDGFRYVIPQGSPLYGIGNNEQITSISNCYVLPPLEDTYSSILRRDEELVQIYKARGGAGIDVSGLRPRGMGVSGSAKVSDGIINFMERFSNTTKEVAMAGRRGALLISIDCYHPEVDSFIRIKRDLSKVTGANISVKWHDGFLKAVEKDEDIILRFPVDSTPEKAKFTRTVKARDIWNEFIKSAHKSAEPGCLFWDTIVNQSISDCYGDYKTVSTNPCGELPLHGFGTCLLMVMNLSSFVKNRFMPDAEFDFSLFREKVNVAMRMMDDIVDMEMEKMDKLISGVNSKRLEDETLKQVELNLWRTVREKISNARKVGLGITALADVFAYMNIKYGDKNSIQLADQIFKILYEQSYETSMTLAKERGHFPAWKWADEKDSHYIKMLPESLQHKIKEHGRRNMACNTCSPAGSISILAGTSSGIEPVFKREYIRRRKTYGDESRKDGTYVDSDGISWINYNVNHQGLQEWKKMFPGKDVKESPYWGCQADEIDWRTRISMQSTIQKYIDSSISSTINLPGSVAEKEVDEIYMHAWKSRLKGVTIYREGCRHGVMLDKSDNSGNDIKECLCPKRPGILPCEIHYSNIQGNNWIFFVGLLNGRPYEIMGGKKKNIEIPKKFKSGWIKKNGKNEEGNSTYDLYLGNLEDTDDRMIVHDIVSEFSPDAGSYTRIVSTMLRHGIPIKFVCEQLYKDSSKAHMASFESGISRVLKKYIKDGEEANETCPKCKAILVYKDGCKSCVQCGWAKC
jgi:ribonucleoside-diphosphate reductase alpha chain